MGDENLSERLAELRRWWDRDKMLTSTHQGESLRIAERLEVRAGELEQHIDDAEARCERMREALERLCQDPDLVGSPAAWRRCVENPNRTKPPCRACAALDTDTTAVQTQQATNDRA